MIASSDNSIVSRDNSTVSRDNSTVSRDNSTVSRDDSTKHLPKWRENLLKLRGEHGIINSVQNVKLTGSTGSHCSEQRFYTMRPRLIVEVLMDDQGGIDLFFTPNELNVPTHCILDLVSYNKIFPRFRLSDLFINYFSGEGKWQNCASFINDRYLVHEFYDEAVVTSETVAVFELDLWQVTSKYFIPVTCDKQYSFLSRLQHILSV